VVQGAFGLSRLLIEQVIEDVFVALNQSLRILLSVLQLLISVTLDPLQECSEGQLLRMAQLGLLLLQNCLHFSF